MTQDVTTSKIQYDKQSDIPHWTHSTFQVLNVFVVSVTGWKERKICGFWDWGRFMGTPLWIIGMKSKVTQDVTTSKIQYDKQSDTSLTAYYLICMYTITMYYSVIVATFRRRGRCSDLAKLLPASLTRVTTTCFGYSLIQREPFSLRFPTIQILYKTSCFQYWCH